MIHLSLSACTPPCFNTHTAPRTPDAGLTRTIVYVGDTHAPRYHSEVLVMLAYW
jgi:hypothetical protein